MVLVVGDGNGDGGAMVVGGMAWGGGVCNQLFD